jgi:hypothetical protein
VREPPLLPPGGAVDEQARRVDLGRHVGELPLDRLVFRDPLPKGPALLRVRQRDVVRGLRDSERLRRDADPAAVQRRHRDAKASVLLVQEPVAADVRLLHDDVVGH